MWNIPFSFSFPSALPFFPPVFGIGFHHNDQKNNVFFHTFLQSQNFFLLAIDIFLFVSYNACIKRKKGFLFLDTYISAFLDYLIQVKKASVNTIASYRRDLCCFSLYAQKMGIAALTDATKTIVMSYLYSLEMANRSAATISRNTASLRSFYHFLLSEHLVEENPVSGYEAPKVEKHPPQILSIEEMERLLAQPKPNDMKGARDKAMLQLLSTTGLRVTELVSIRCADLSLAAGCLTCGDGTKERIIPLSGETIAALRLYLETYRPMLDRNDGNDFLFLNYTGQPMSRQGFWKLLKSYAQKAGIQKDITPQMLRHSFACHRLENGCDIETLREMMGHSDISSTLLYAKMNLQK